MFQHKKTYKNFMIGHKNFGDFKMLNVPAAILEVKKLEK